MTYEYTGRGLRTASSRSMQVDLLIPTLMHSDPAEAAELREYANSRKKQLAEAKIIPDIFYFKALVTQKQVPSSKTSDLQANVTNDDLVIDFLKLHKLFTYKLQGAGNGLELAAMRDYTLDVGLQLQDGEFSDAVRAKDAFAQTKTLLGNHSPTSAFRMFKFALSLYPCLYKEIEKEPALKSLRNDADFQPTWDAAIKGCEALMKARADRNKAAQDARDAAAAAKAAAGK